MYLALIVAYIGVLRYMAEKPEETVAVGTETAAGVIAGGIRA